MEGGIDLSQVPVGVEEVAPCGHARHRPQIGQRVHSSVAGEDHVQLPAEHPEHGYIQDGHQQLDAYGPGPHGECLVEAHGHQALRGPAAVFRRHGQGGDVPDLVGLEVQPGALHHDVRALAPAGFEVVEALEPGRGGRDHADHPRRQTAQWSTMTMNRLLSS